MSILPFEPEASVNVKLFAVILVAVVVIGVSVYNFAISNQESVNNNEKKGIIKKKVKIHTFNDRTP